MTHVAFFGHDAADAGIRRRVEGFRADGLTVTGFMMRRRDRVNANWENVDLGRTFDANYLQRIRSIFAGARRAAAEREKLAAADIIYARNLDMLATAFLARRIAGLKTPVIYEALDVHRLLTRKDAIGLALRRVEGALLARTESLVVSSPAFLESYFERHHKGRYRARLIENRLAADGAYGPRPSPRSMLPQGPLRIGWVGVLRCARSLDLLLNVARELGPEVRIVMHGVPALTQIPDFHEKVQTASNVEFHGPYRAPEDLARVYSGLNVVWAGDFMEAGFNSVWLLPNRLYEGGYFGVPAIAPADTQSARWIQERGAGFVASEPLHHGLAALVRDLAANRATVAAHRSRLMDLPENMFVQPRGEMAALVRDALRSNAHQGNVNLEQIGTLVARDCPIPNN